MIVVGGHPTTRGFKEYVWVTVPCVTGTALCTAPKHEQTDYAHVYRESQWKWIFKNWHTVLQEEQEGA